MCGRLDIGNFADFHGLEFEDEYEDEVECCGYFGYGRYVFSPLYITSTWANEIVLRP
jgi:hypothetical protein